MKTLREIREDEELYLKEQQLFFMLDFLSLAKPAGATQMQLLYDLLGDRVSFNEFSQLILSLSPNTIHQQFSRFPRPVITNILHARDLIGSSRYASALVYDTWKYYANSVTVGKYKGLRLNRERPDSFRMSQNIHMLQRQGIYGILTSSSYVRKRLCNVLTRMVRTNTYTDYNWVQDTMKSARGGAFFIVRRMRRDAIPNLTCIVKTLSIDEAKSKDQFYDALFWAPIRSEIQGTAIHIPGFKHRRIISAGDWDLPRLLKAHYLWIASESSPFYMHSQYFAYIHTQNRELKQVLVDRSNLDLSNVIPFILWPTADPL